MGLYQTLQKVSTKLVRQFGQPVIITRHEEAVQDPATGIVSRSSSSVTSEYGVLLDFEYRNFGEGLKLNDPIIRFNKRLLLTTGVVVKTGDDVEADGQIYRIAVVKSVNPAGTRLLYDLWMQ